jgi:preprotein translocase subunit SecF
MKKNLNNKILGILVVLVICIYGIFGVPSGVTGKALMEAMTKRIHLGLDLKGGAHLILQVKVEEAVNAETDNTVAPHQGGSEDGQPELFAGLQARSGQGYADPCGGRAAGQVQ